MFVYVVNSGRHLKVTSSRSVLHPLLLSGDLQMFVHRALMINYFLAHPDPGRDGGRPSCSITENVFLLFRMIKFVLNLCCQSGCLCDMKLKAFFCVGSIIFSLKEQYKEQYIYNYILFLSSLGIWLI